jgi:MOSC domain-containing protein YiiM
MSGKLVAIYVKRFKRGPMDPASRAQVIAGKGIVGNANQGGKRQVTLIEREVWDALMHEVDAELPPSTRRANLVVESFPLKESRGKTLHIGNCSFRVYGETKPCERMEEAAKGLRDAMYPEWRGGAFAEVLVDGEIAVGDEVRWE